MEYRFVILIKDVNESMIEAHDHVLVFAAWNALGPYLTERETAMEIIDALFPCSKEHWHDRQTRLTCWRRYNVQI